MTVVEPTGSNAPGLVDRAKNILLQPAAEWDRIKAEQSTLPALLTGYILPLAALSAICAFIGLSFVGVGAFGFSAKMPIAFGLMMAVLRVVGALVGVWLLALVTKMLAPTFGSTPDQAQANKLAVYSSTATLLGGVFSLVPMLGVLGLLAAIYSLVLLYLGLPRLMNTPEDKRVGYFASIIGVCIVAGIVVSAVFGAISGPFMASSFMTGASSPFGMHASRSDDVNITLPGGVTINSGEAERAAKQLEQAYSGAQQNAANAKPIDLALLSALLPQALPGGFARTETSSGSGGAMGMNIGNAQAVYQNGDKRLTLEITDMGAAGAFAGMAAAMNVQSNRQTADGYERTRTENGRVVTEEVDRKAQTAHYMVVTTNRVAIDAHGTNVSPEEVQAAVASVLGPAEALARAT